MWRHDFVEGLKDGSLPRESFLHYLRQDYVFLVHFSRAWGLAIAKSDDIAEMRLCAEVVNALLNHEMQLHIETCAKEGISEAELFATEEATANLAYTRFVIDRGVGGDFLDLITALAPCVLGYGEIGARLGATEPGPEHPFRDWIATYAGEDYQGLCHAFGAILDSAAQRRLGTGDSPRKADLQRIFDMATRLEVGFWTMGLHRET